MLDRPTSVLFPARQDRERLEKCLTSELAAAHQRLVDGPVTPEFDLGSFRHEMAEFDFVVPRPVNELVSWTVAKLERGLVHVSHPRYFGLFNPAPTFPAECADRIVAAFNPQLATARTSPAAVEIEAHVVRALAVRAGFPPTSGGHFTSGGSEANFTSLVCALTRASPLFATEGARAFDGQPTFYISRESHLAWLKIAHQAGLGRSAARLVATDGSGRMDPEALIHAVRLDQEQGRMPVMIVATAGTTNAGMIDPLDACAEIARSFNLWYHVDAAWGGAVVSSDRYRPLLQGIEHADSVTIDAHKWFATTMGCGIFIARHPESLAAAFQVSTSFMPSNNPSVDPYVTSLQWSRRFIGLRFFLSLAAAGWAGYGAHVERAIELASVLKERLTDRGWTISNSSSLAVLCLEPPIGAGSIQATVSRVVASGRAWISAATFEGRDVIRVCVTHGQTTLADIEVLVEAMHPGASFGDGDALNRAS
jgi:aromatic-L-amino-acid decarboxylase